MIGNPFAVLDPLCFTQIYRGRKAPRDAPADGAFADDGQRQACAQASALLRARARDIARGWRSAQLLR
ncbi:hypothetical protein DCO48_07940 [Pseudomonas sp. SDI]|uniref:hypothetical protein n=1 Tax=Pseudomonas sp. SDI TaxID=2170734 RepID=UPI000DE724B0|nr:hypothetical protein [Pseudomonas sp. SDI]PWB33901.1 hypothetical protein DCO48_07940 [Pseudomonas sp. SDI]